MILRLTFVVDLTLPDTTRENWQEAVVEVKESLLSVSSMGVVARADVERLGTNERLNLLDQQGQPLAAISGVPCSPQHTV